MRWRIPLNTSILSEARLYAMESASHTMDYSGWEDQYKKLERLTYGKFAQLWVYELCRINGVECKKDKSPPTEPDDSDLEICGFSVDVKASTSPNLIGQVSPGVYGRSNDFYCFALTDKDCSYIEVPGVISCADYRKHAIRVPNGEIIPGTNIKQRFGTSYFLPKEGGLMIPFFRFMNAAKEGRLDQILGEANAA